MAVEPNDAGPPVSGHAGMVERVKRILLQPKLEWERIDAEQTSVGELFRGWVLILAAVPALAGLIGSLVFGYSFLGITYRPSIGEALTSAVTQYVLAIVGVFVLALIIDALAPRFGGVSNRVQAVKVAAYSATAAWVAGIFNLLPALAMLSILGLYSLYLLYLGLPRLMKAPDDKAMPYTLVTVAAAILLALLIGAIMAPVTALFRGPVPASSGELSGTVSVPGGGELDLGKLEEASKQMQAAAARMESSAAGGAAAAVAPATLQALLPASLGAYRRAEISSSGADAGGFGGSQAEARYENGDSNIRLEVTDIAAAGALAAMGSALGAQASRQTDTGYEKTETVDGRMVTEKWDNQAGEGSYGVMVANRFMVQAEGKVPSIDLLKQSVNAVGIERLEALAR